MEILPMWNLYRPRAVQWPLPCTAEMAVRTLLGDPLASLLAQLTRDREMEDFLRFLEWLLLLQRL